MGVIYKITNPNGRFYIGKTSCFRRRMYNYKNDSHKILDSVIMRSIRKYGWDAHTVEIVEEIDDSILAEREIFWISELRSCREYNKLGMNITIGGEGESWKHDKERVRKHSLRMTENNPFKGKHHPEEWRKQKAKNVSEYNKKNGVRISDTSRERGLFLIRKQIVAYDSEGCFIKEFTSLTSAASHFDVKIETITKAVLKNQICHNKWFFRYKTEDYPLQIQANNSKLPNSKKAIVVMDKFHNVVREHNSAREASLFWGTSVKAVARMKVLKPNRSGYIFIYKDDLANILSKEKVA